MTPIILSHGSEYIVLHYTVYELLHHYVENHGRLGSDFTSLFAHLGVERGSKVFEYMERYYTACNKVDPAWSPATWFLNYAKSHLTIPNGVISDLEPGQARPSNPSAEKHKDNGVKPVPVLAWVASQNLTVDSFKIEFLEKLVPEEQRPGRLILYHGTSQSSAESILEGVGLTLMQQRPLSMILA